VTDQADRIPCIRVPLRQVEAVANALRARGHGDIADDIDKEILYRAYPPPQDGQDQSVLFWSQDPSVTAIVSDVLGRSSP
jgi:hypothetical protein